MANTRTSAKRARQAVKRQVHNQTIRSTTKTALSRAVEAIKGKDVEKAKKAYSDAIKAVSKAATKGAMPKGRASRKTSRLTLFAKKTLPTMFTST